MKTENMNAYLDNITLENFGRSRTLALAGRACVTCGKPATEFRDALSVKEYGISGMCQACQDSVFLCEPEE
jgi:hypothetical protein